MGKQISKQTATMDEHPTNSYNLSENQDDVHNRRRSRTNSVDETHGRDRPMKRIKSGSASSGATMSSNSQQPLECDWASDSVGGCERVSTTEDDVPMDARESETLSDIDVWF